MTIWFIYDEYHCKTNCQSIIEKLIKTECKNEQVKLRNEAMHDAHAKVAFVMTNVVYDFFCVFAKKNKNFFFVYKFDFGALFATPNRIKNDKEDFGKVTITSPEIRKQ